MNDRYYIVFDFETGSADPNSCEILQIGAVAIHPRKLEIVDEFNLYSQPLEPDKVEAGALQVTGIKLEDVLKAPHPKLVWGQFREFIEKYNTGANKGNYTAPIAAGYNIINFDLPIVERYCKLYGPTDKKSGGQGLFNGLHKLDLMHEIFKWTENQDVPTGNNGRQSLSLDNVLKWLGIDNKGSHNALVDVKNTAKVFLRFLAWYRKKYDGMKFEEAFRNG